MTIGELIAALSNLDPETRVFVNGYERGYCDAAEGPFEVETFDLNVNSESYYGPHEITSERTQGRSAQAKGIIL